MRRIEMVRIYVRNVTKHYDQKLILNNISPDIKDNGIFCMTGPSGGSKTTLLKIAAGLDANE